MTGDRAADETSESRDQPDSDERTTMPADGSDETDERTTMPVDESDESAKSEESDESGESAKADETDESDESGETDERTTMPVGETPEEAAKGRLIAGRYRLRRRIGGGAMGVVYLAHDELLDRTVALKELLLPPTLSAEEAETARKRSQREARLAARLQHRHAISVFNVVEDDGKPVLVMEYLESQSLAEVVAERGSLPPDEVARIGAEAASALAAAHEAGIVHRDVKPGNILIGANGTTKITDFGISRAADDGTLTGSGRFAGTPAFLAPEAARGEAPSQASDVFSLGATLYTTVEGRFPYGDSDNQMAVLYAAAAGRFTAPTKAGPLTPVLTHMMQLNPADRPTMAEAAQALAKVSSPEPAPSRNNRVLAVALALVVLAVAGVVTAFLLNGKDNGGSAAPPTSAPATTAPPPASSPQSSSAGPNPATTYVTTTVIAAPPASTGEPAGPPPGGPKGPISLVEAVSEYYQIIPGNLDLGWTKLGPGIQRIGKEEYVKYWSPISNLVVVSGPAQTGPDSVTVTFEYTKGGQRYRETHQLGMIVTNGQPLINSDPPVGYTIVG
ncbi:serine/threonine-protein kinase [Amycolatopsis pigmentata]|uniref:non-specific serine/threonine protein kinase n=1 Tax=Amycolatopsis pigmentata TaxID=450801 RepID=A0ABW5FXH9_9PSEU